MILLFVLACGNKAAEPSDDPSPVEDSGGSSYPELEPCASKPCVTELSPAYAVGGPFSYFGQQLAVLDDGGEPLVGVGAPAGAIDSPYYVASAHLFRADGLERLADWPSDIDFDFAGASVALTRESGTDQAVVAIGALGAVVDLVPETGKIYLVNGDAATGATLQTAARASISGSGLGFDRPRLGARLEWLDVDGSGELDLVAAAWGYTFADDDTRVNGSAVLVFPGDLVGDHDGSRATGAIRATTLGLGGSMAGWDGNLDGIADLIVTDVLVNDADLLFFEGPWTGELTNADHSSSWESGYDMVQKMTSLGDLDGDGSAELGVGGAVWTAAAERGGAMWIIAGGDVAGGSLADEPWHLYGDEPGEGCGSGMASGDVDGDGQADLVVGCQGLSPGVFPGKVLVFTGPLDRSALDEADAAVVVHGERPFDWFGIDVETVDADQDGRSDVLVGASGVDYGAGAVYLIGGSALLP